MSDRAFMEHEIRAKVSIGAKLTSREESYYLLRMATHSERIEYIKKKKGVQNGTSKVNTQGWHD